MPSPPETIETERLVLRVPVMEDAAAMLESYARDPEVTRYLTWKPLQSLEEAERAIRSRVEGRQKGASFSWTILLKEGGALVGTISLRPQGPRLRSAAIYDLIPIPTCGKQLRRSASAASPSIGLEK
jgi:RimJ/RimL family protein N-acetyltransferase